MDQFKCDGCRKTFEGTLYSWKDYTEGLHEEFEDAQLGSKTECADAAVQGYTCAACRAFVCEACKKPRAKFHWWHGWEKSVCPSCRRKFGPGQVLIG